MILKLSRRGWCRPVAFKTSVAPQFLGCKKIWEDHGVNRKYYDLGIIWFIAKKNIGFSIPILLLYLWCNVFLVLSYITLYIKEGYYALWSPMWVRTTKNVWISLVSTITLPLTHTIQHYDITIISCKGSSLTSLYSL